MSKRLIGFSGLFISTSFAIQPAPQTLESHCYQKTIPQDQHLLRAPAIDRDDYFECTETESGQMSLAPKSKEIREQF